MEKKLDPKALVKVGLGKALEAQYPLAVDNVARLRRVHPDKSPSELIAYMNRVYVAAVATTGAGAGASAIVPNGLVQVPVALAEMLTFLEASVLYTLSVAEVYGLNTEDIERRRALVTAVLIGDSAATKILDPLIEHTAPHWGRKIVQAIPMPAINKANKVLGHHFVTKYGTKTGALVLGKQIPMFIGVGIGAGGNSLFGWFIVRAARKLLGDPPELWTEHPQLIESPDTTGAPQH